MENFRHESTATTRILATVSKSTRSEHDSKSSIDTAEGNNMMYSISLIYEIENASWQIERSANDFFELDEKLRSCENKKISIENSGVDGTTPHPMLLALQDSEEDRRLQFEIYLNDICMYYNSTIWNVEPLIRFIDDKPSPSMMTQIHLGTMSKQIEYLQLKTLDYEFKLRNLEVGYNQMKDFVRMWNNHSNEPSSTSREEDDSFVNNDIPEREMKQKRAEMRKLISPRSSINSVNRSSFITTTTVDSFVSNTSSSPDVLKMQSNKTRVMDDEEEESQSLNVHNNDSISKPINTSIVDEPQPINDNTLTEEISPVSQEEEPILDLPPLPGSKYLSSDLLPNREKAKFYDNAINDVIQTLQPHESQLQYRLSVVGLLKRQIRSCLFSTSFEIGVAAIRCFLPDDSTRLSVIISKSYISNWYGSLSERLNYLAERGIPMEDDEQLDILVEEPKPVAPHVVNNNVNVVKESTGRYHVNCSVDAMEVEITVNSRMDQCLLSFMEEIALLVGNDNLFKRSLILIRAWWCYETASYVGCPIRHYLSDWAFCIMVCAIFNQHHGRIFSPFQALCLFLAEYSGYDSVNFAITLQGVVPFQSHNSNIPILMVPKPGDLITASLLEKFKNVYLANPDVLDEVPFPDSRDTTMMVETSNILDRGESVEVSSPNLDVQPFAVKNFGTSLSEQFSFPGISEQNNLNSFERMGFNIVNPINESNMITEKLSQRRLMRLAKAFQIGAANLSVFLKQSNENLINSFNVIKNYFPAVSARFVDDWRPDAINNSVLVPRFDGSKYISNNSRDLMNVSSVNLWKNILYSNFLLESMVSEAALLTVSVEILSSKGPLPVGEIGKVLAELTCIPNLSLKLKERFGGLKKFLEHFSDKFAISNDHPFNPHVMLRDTLSAEHLELIDRGIFPHQLLMKTRKLTTSVKKGAVNKKQAYLYSGVSNSDVAIPYGSRPSPDYSANNYPHNMNINKYGNPSVQNLPASNMAMNHPYGAASGIQPSQQYNNNKYPRHSIPNAQNVTRQTKPGGLYSNNPPNNVSNSMSGSLITPRPAFPRQDSPQSLSLGNNPSNSMPPFSLQPKHGMTSQLNPSSVPFEMRGAGFISGGTKSSPLGGGGGGLSTSGFLREDPQQLHHQHLSPTFMSGGGNVFDATVPQSISGNPSRSGSLYQPEYIDNSVLVGEHHSNSLLSQLRDSSTELVSGLPMANQSDNYRLRSNPTGFKGDPSNSNNSLLMSSFSSSFPAADPQGYGASNIFQSSAGGSLSGAFLSNSAGAYNNNNSSSNNALNSDSSVTYDSFFSRNGGGVSLNNNSSNINTSQPQSPDALSSRFNSQPGSLF
eukprot:CAMPEP_0170131784 /NCGR_PEP_ID=MMETSP0020_2-20130122/23479_1 /TAXON_ID=98059 /ORGANISM="Dinobryon sp., Strain UTEXLB2267" /LENGTH=1331 /DNA_ID=CAMNT_0010366975 /DNA_START=37 /DNA_END=4032 /DNA_ORIENTATION=+